MTSSPQCRRFYRDRASREHLVALGALPIEMGWCVGEALLVPFLMTLNLPSYLASLVWLLNPILGTFMQPWCGGLSDNCTSDWGRRKPFLIIFSAMAALGVFLIVFSLWFGELLSGLCGSSKSISIVIVFVGFGLMDISLDLLLTPTRALLNDNAQSDEDLHRINNLYTSFAVLGRICGFVICTFLPDSVIAYMGGNRFFACLLINLTVLGGCMAAVVSIADEKNQGDSQQLASHGDISWRDLPREFAVLWVMQFGGWLVTCNFCFFFSSYCAFCVFGGTDVHGTNFNNGVLFATFGFVIQAFISLFVNLALPFLNKNLGTGRVYCIAELLGSIAMSLTAILRDKESTIVLISICGLMYPVHISNAFVLLETLPSLKHSTMRNRGLLNGYMNNAMVYAQITVAVLAAAQNYFSSKQEPMSCGTISSVAIFVLTVDCFLLVCFPKALLLPTINTSHRQVRLCKNGVIDEATPLRETAALLYKK
eukprot:jgi/Bigna1/78784/fgenesh1_pg.57_\